MRALSIVLGVLALAVGGLLIGIHVDEALRTRAYASGLTAQATIRSADIVAKRNSKGNVRYRVDVTYSFQVDGRTYIVSRAFLEPFQTSRKREAAAVAAAFPAGEKRTAYYLPNHPERAILEPRITRNIVNPIFGGAAVGSVGLALVLFPFSIRRFYHPDLPVNTRATEHGFAILPSTGWFAAGLIASIFLGLATAGIGGLSQPHWPREPSMPEVYAYAAVAILIPLVLRVLLGLLVHPLSGAILLNHAEGSLALSPLRRGASPRFIKPYEQVIDAGLHFRPAKHAKTPGSTAATFSLEIASLPSDGGVGHADLPLPARQFRNHLFQRDDAHELLGWLRHELALDQGQGSLAVPAEEHRA